MSRFVEVALRRVDQRYVFAYDAQDLYHSARRDPDAASACRRLTVAIINHDTADVLERCLDALFASRLGDDVEVVVVDTASSDDSVERARRHAKVRVLALGLNVGYGFAANVAAQLSDSRYFAIMNADIVIGAGTVARALDYLDEHPEVGALSPALLDADRRPYPVMVRAPSLLYEFLTSFYAPRLPVLRRFTDPYFLWADELDGDRSVEILPGAMVICRRDAFEGVGGFNLRYRMYYEDVELSVALRRAGWSLAVVGGAPAVHLGGQSYVGHRLAMQRHLQRSRIRFHRTYSGWLGNIAIRAAVLTEALVRIVASPFPALLRRKRSPRDRRDALLTGFVLLKEALRPHAF